MTGKEVCDILKDIDNSEVPEVAEAVSQAVRAVEMLDRLEAYLEELKVQYSPESIRNGKWIGGDEKLFHFVKDLEDEFKQW